MPDETRERQSNRSTDRTLFDNTVTPLLNVLADNPLLHPQSDNLLLLPHTGEQHPLRKKMGLMACKLSGQASCREMFLTKQPKSSCIPGQMSPSSNTSLTSKLGSSCVVNGRLINPYDPPLTRVLDFLASLFDRGLKYDAINTAKSAISAIDFRTQTRSYTRKPTSNLEVYEWCASKQTPCPSL